MVGCTALNRARSPAAFCPVLAWLYANAKRVLQSFNAHAKNVSYGAPCPLRLRFDPDEAICRPRHQRSSDPLWRTCSGDRLARWKASVAVSIWWRSGNCSWHRKHDRYELWQHHEYHIHRNGWRCDRKRRMSFDVHCGAKSIKLVRYRHSRSQRSRVLMKDLKRPRFWLCVGLVWWFLPTLLFIVSCGSSAGRL